jgi:hypothetical protein
MLYNSFQESLLKNGLAHFTFFSNEFGDLEIYASGKEVGHNCTSQGKGEPK